jgi:hypothetical protein
MKKGKHPTSNIQHPTPNGVATDIWEFNDGHPVDRKFDLEERLMEFATAVIDLSEKLPNSRAGNHIAGQILRSGTSPYPNHGEAEDAESREDFVHELNCIFFSSIQTAKKNALTERRKTSLQYPAGEAG